MSDPSLDREAEMIRRTDQLLKDEYDRNKPFNQALNGERPLQVTSLMEDVDAYKIEPSEALFWADRESYNEELLAWRQRRMEKKHQAAETLLKDNEQTGLLKELAETIGRNRIVPFLGAGMSLPCGFPLWGRTLEKLKTRVEGLDIAAFDKAMADYDYLTAAQLLWEADEIQVQIFIRSRFAKSELPRDGLKGPVVQVAKISSGCIVTTNYDRIIETLFDKTIDGYMHGLQRGHNFVPNLIRGDRCLLKLHGDVDNPDSFVFTKSQYNQAYGDTLDFKRPLPKALRQIFIGHSLLFLGCSLVQDRTLELFESVIENEEFEVPDHYAILPEPQQGETRVQKENRLLRIKVRPIWYPAGKHKYVENLLDLAIDIAQGVHTL